MIKTEIEEGQKYVDEPVYLQPAECLMSKVADAVAEAVGSVVWVNQSFGDGLDGKMRVRKDLPKPILLRYERTQLRWMKPGPDGKLIPK